MAYSSVDTVRESCANTLTKILGYELLTDKLDVSYHYYIISIAE
jgi:hypothetical protein